MTYRLYLPKLLSIQSWWNHHQQSVSSSTREYYYVIPKPIIAS
jgi:hypothetical protein